MLENVAVKLLPTAVFVVVALMMFAFLKLANVVHRRYGKAPFSADGLIREPAYTKRRRQRALEIDIFWHAIAVPTLVFAWYFASTVRIDNQPRSDLTDFILIFAAGLVALAYFIQRLVRLITEKRHLVVATSAEVATGQYINQLMRYGYWVFHDVSLAGQQLQHLIVGPAGVFVVESKAHRVPRKYLKPDAERAQVNFDGAQLVYPDWTDTDPIQAVLRQSQIIGKWLSSKISDTVTPQPVLALPGWYVQSSDWKRVIACNPSNPAIIVKGSNQARLDATTVREILLSLKQATRDKLLQIPASKVPQ